MTLHANLNIGFWIAETETRQCTFIDCNKHLDTEQHTTLPLVDEQQPICSMLTLVFWTLEMISTIWR
jgi:hypothetical protein